MMSIKNQKMVKAVNYDVIIAGGGAAGCMAAVRSSLSDRITLVIEPNKRLGRKLMITGKGRGGMKNDRFSRGNCRR